MWYWLAISIFFCLVFAFHFSWTVFRLWNKEASPTLSLRNMFPVRASRQGFLSHNNCLYIRTLSRLYPLGLLPVWLAIHICLKTISYRQQPSSKRTPVMDLSISLLLLLCLQLEWSIRYHNTRAALLLQAYHSHHHSLVMEGSEMQIIFLEISA